jgi:hypothetical protein
MYAHMNKGIKKKSPERAQINNTMMHLKLLGK